MTTTVANQWEVLTYDFSAAPDLDYVSFIVFYDFGNQSAGVYHFDEIQVGLGEYIPTQAPTVAIEDFEGDLPGNFSFGGVEGVQIVENPNSSGIFWPQNGPLPGPTLASLGASLASKMLDLPRY